MFESKINELEWGFFFFSFFSERRGLNESDHTCQDQTLQTKAVCSFVQRQKQSLNIFSLKKNKAQAVGERKPELTFHHLFALGKWS